MRPRVAGVALALLGVASIVAAQSFAIAPKVGSTGAGADLTIGVARTLNLRIGAQGWSRSETRTEQEIEYDAELKLLSGQALVDLHPGGGHFRVSAGVVFNGNELTAISSEDAVYTINGRTYPVGLVGRLSGRAETAPIAPYVGLGWGNAVAPGSRWRLAVDAGAFYQGEPEVSLTADPTIPILVPAQFFEDLEEERREIEEDAADYTVYPVLAVGISYRF